MNEVITHINEDLKLTVVDSFSDWGDKMSILRKNPECPLKENQVVIGYEGPQKYFGVCEFSVLKKGDEEFFVIWDYRENQPFNECSHCVSSEFGFGRYEFMDRESFYNHITSDFGYTIWDTSRMEELVKNEKLTLQN